MTAGPRLKDLGGWYSGGTPPRDDESAWQGSIPWLSAKDVDRDHLREPTAFITEAAAQAFSRVVPPSSIVVIVRGMALVHGLPVALTTQRSAFNQDLRALVPGAQFAARYLHYALRGNRARLGIHIDKAAHGTARVIDSIYSERVFVPDLDRQSLVADFLDRESERLKRVTSSARLVAQREQELQLAHLRTLLEVETAGGRQVRTYFRLQRGMDLPDDARVPGPYDVIGSGGPLARHHEGPVAAPAVVTGRYGSVGHVHWSDSPCWPPNTTLYVSTLNDCMPRFAFWILRALPLREEGAKSAVPGVHRADIGRLRIGDFSLREQATLVADFDARERRGLRLAQATRTLCDRLTEYRDALITEAVTGQLNVTKLSESQLDEAAHAAAEGERPELLTK